jgi:hypothetical protein
MESNYNEIFQGTLLAGLNLKLLSGTFATAMIILH